MINHNPTNTYGLGSVCPDPDAPTFQLPVREPGWYPDATDTNAARGQVVFPEEACQYTKETGAIPFPVPFSDDTPIPNPDDPTNGWILGGPIPDSPDDPKTYRFATLIREIARRVRLYNTSLHQLRRLHFKKKFNLAPTQNPDGDTRPVPEDPTCKEFLKMAYDAELAWICANKCLNDLLDNGGEAEGTFNHRIVAADMVQVNNYIVAVRLVANQIPPDGEVSVFEAGGSSSSHFAISSPFAPMA
jgi:hypothetical protein